jgi:hypothetical protein
MEKTLVNPYIETDPTAPSVEDLEKILINPFPSEKTSDGTGGRGGYKIIEQAVLDLTCPLGTRVMGKSELSNGFSVRVKECSPKQEWEEIRDVLNESSVSETAKQFQDRYNVPNEEIYRCYK